LVNQRGFLGAKPPGENFLCRQKIKKEKFYGLNIDDKKVRKSGSPALSFLSDLSIQGDILLVSINNFL